ncbi:unnamed protein product [Rodentolepis nana]|uniref:ANK_REP_REGION domain-containing protein n=1 Tax=Rodentolepis nana TaxID=102285 RepID=A0A0R3TQ49_RODNA|nr:unnamed protein product [Rodentolepis nana]
MMECKVDSKIMDFIKAVKANNVEEVKAQLQLGTSPNSRKTPAKKTGLMIAATRGYTDVMKVLLDAGASTDPTEMLMNTAFHFACSSGVVRSVELLIEAGSEIARPNAFHKTPLMVAIMHNRLEVVKVLLNIDPQLRVGFLYGDDSELTLACQQSDLRIAKYLLENFKPIVGLKNELQIALLRAVVQHRPDVLNMLVGYGADINYLDMFIDPPIFTAIRSKDTMMLQYLLDLGADVNKKCFGRDSPLLFAIKHDNEPAIKMLIKKGATVNARKARSRLKELRNETYKRLDSMEAAVQAVMVEGEEESDEDESSSSSSSDKTSSDESSSDDTSDETEDETKDEPEEQRREVEIEQPVHEQS